MAQISLPIGGFNYTVSCRDGEETHLIKLGESVARKVEDAKAAVGNPGEVRQLLLAAILFADENNDLKSQSKNDPQQPAAVSAPAMPPVDTGAMLAMAERLERLASLLENSANTP